MIGWESFILACWLPADKGMQGTRSNFSKVSTKRTLGRGDAVVFDFKKEYRELYLPGNKPEIIDVPPVNYIAVRGAGDPNEDGGAYQHPFL